MAGVEQLQAELARARAREAELTALYETAQDLAKIRDLDHVLAAIVRRARSLLQADMTYLSLNDEGDGASYMKVTEGALTPEFGRLRLPLGTGLLGLVAQTGAAYFTEDYQADKRFLHRNYIDEAVDGEHIRAILGVPLYVDGRVIGALLAVHRRVRPFPPDEVALLGRFADHAALAIENARLFEQARDAIVEADRANSLLRTRSASVERAAHAHDRLTEVLLHRRGVVGLVEVLGDALAAEVGVYDDQRRLLSGDTGLPPGDTARLEEAVQQARASGHAVEVAPGWWLAVPAAADEPLGLLVVHRHDGLDVAEVRTLERAAIVTALLLLFDRTEADAEQRVRGDLLADLLDDRADADRVRERMRLLGVDPERRVRVMVTAPAEAASERHRWVRAAARFAAERGGLGGEHDGRIVVVTPVGEADDAAALQQRMGGGATIGVAVGDAGPAAARATWREARRCLDALVSLGRLGEVADPTALGVARLLLGDNGPEALADFVDATLGPLLERDTGRRTALTDTVAAWFAHGGNARATAAALHVHVNTVTQRLDRVTRLLGEDWRRGARALDLQLALHMQRLRG